MNEDTTVVIRHADGPVTVRAEDCADIVIYRGSAGDLFLKQDEDLILFPSNGINEVLSVLDLMSTEGSPEEDIEDYLETERTAAYVDGFCDGYDEGLLESENAFADSFEDGLHYEDEDFESMDEEFDTIAERASVFADGEMDDYIV